jgi:hypothetical protein
MMLVLASISLFAQEEGEEGNGGTETEQEVVYFQEETEKKDAAATIDSLSAIPEEFVDNVADSLNQLTKQGETQLDSITNLPESVLQSVADSINNLAFVKSGIQSRIDSLQQKLEELKDKGDQPQEKIEELEAKLQSRIDSLQQKFTDKLGLGKIDKYTNSLQGDDVTDQLSADNLPGMEKLSISEIPSLNVEGLETSDLSNTGINSLTSQVDEQLGKVTDIDKDLINNNLAEYKQISGEVGEYTEMIKDPSKMDQAIDSQASQLSEYHAFNEETQELAAMEELPESMLADLKRYQDEQALKEQAKEEVVQQATDYFAEHQDKLTEVQSLMTQLKKKYSYVPDSRDLSTAVKATSLKEEPLKKRIRFGLGFQIQQTNPVSVDLAPNVMFRFNTNFNAGISGTYRAALGKEDKNATPIGTTTDVYGGSVLAQHMVWKGFFGHAEFQSLSLLVEDASADHLTRKWTNGALLGIGKQMALAKGLRGQIIFTYDFLHSDDSVNPKAWNIRFGLQLGNFKLKDINF